MADRGSIGVAVSHTPAVYLTPNMWSGATAGIGYAMNRAFQKPLPVWKGTNFTGATDANNQAGLLNIDVDGVLAGQTQFAGAPLGNVWVNADYRGGSTPSPGGSGVLIARVHSGPDGTWSMRMFEKGKAYYTLTFEVPDSLAASGYNSLVIDNAVPI